ncbi:competence/damage-inducible protein-like protein cinA [Apiospora marii]|uniref:Competence/damage-inducible protein-like protein cinA n=1 Tax=Apiospora marii TaxID=335849 RepID=A0ABR1R7R0_9PEZI
MTSSTSAPSGIFPPEEIRAVLAEVTDLLKSRGESVAVAETAAGGLISASLISAPGASSYYRGGLTLYTLASRLRYAGWTRDSLKSYAGPTPDIVAGLARHVRADLGEGEDDEQKLKGTDITYCLAESGTAGPTGGETRNRTPGYVALAVECDKGCFTREVETGLGNDREANMVRFAVEGLKFLKDVIQGDAKL